MSGKRVGVLIQHSPLIESKAVEALRMAVGLILRDNDVYVLLVGEALEVFSQKASRGAPKGDVHRHLDTLIEFGQQIVAEKESIEGTEGLILPGHLQIWTREGILHFLSECDATIVV